MGKGVGKGVGIKVGTGVGCNVGTGVGVYKSSKRCKEERGRRKYDMVSSDDVFFKFEIRTTNGCFFNCISWQVLMFKETNMMHYGGWEAKQYKK